MTPASAFVPINLDGIGKDISVLVFVILNLKYILKENLAALTVKL
jgi:hypothetical protein